MTVSKNIGRVKQAIRFSTPIGVMILGTATFSQSEPDIHLPPGCIPRVENFFHPVVSQRTFFYFVLAFVLDVEVKPRLETYSCINWGDVVAPRLGFGKSDSA